MKRLKKNKKTFLFKTRHRRFELESQPMPALLQMLLKTVREDTQKPRRKTSREIMRITMELFKRAGYSVRHAHQLSRDLLEQEQ